MSPSPSSDRGHVADCEIVEADVPNTTRSSRSATKLHTHSLRSKLVLALSVMLAVVVAIDEFVRLTVIGPAFSNLERMAAYEDTSRVLSAINTEIDVLADIAAYHVSHPVVETPQTIPRQTTSRSPERSKSVHSKEQRTSELAAPLDKFRAIPSESYRLGKHVHWAAIWDNHGRREWLLEDPNAAFSLPAIDQSLTANQSTEIVRGISTGDDDELYLFAAAPIVREARDDAGVATDATTQLYLVVGRKFDGDLILELGNRTSVAFAVETKLDSDQRQPRIAEHSNEVLEISAPLTSPSEEPLGELTVWLPRDVTTRAAHTTAFARCLSLCGAAASLILLLLLLQRIVIGRIEQIREHTEHIAESGVIAEARQRPRLQVAGRDEIGQLARAFDRMTSRLDEAQKHLSETSRAAGMSLVADTVIHNVGNVLTNVNSLLETAVSKVGRLRVEPLERLAGRLRSARIDDRLQAATPDYLEQLSEAWHHDKDELTELLDTLNDNVQHIHQVIRQQRRHTRPKAILKRTSLQTVIDEAIRCCRARLEEEKVRVVLPDHSDNVWVETDHSVLLQVLINIIGNAGNAMLDVSDRDSVLTIHVYERDQVAELHFRDNGCGMDQQTAARAFDAHFTTRGSGTGLGLHFCAISMRRLGGSIRCESEGVGEGALFIVKIPLDAAELGTTTNTKVERPQHSNFQNSTTVQSQTVQSQQDD
jgi:signal transduction histidine kinase